MSDMKCPFCQQKLKKHLGGDMPEVWCCDNEKCKLQTIGGDIELWQELIHTRKELEQSETCCTEWEKQALDYKAENIALSGDLELTRKALDVAVDALETFARIPQPIAEVAKVKLYAIKEITALEQKD